MHLNRIAAKSVPMARFLDMAAQRGVLWKPNNTSSGIFEMTTPLAYESKSQFLRMMLRDDEVRYLELGEPIQRISRREFPNYDISDLEAMMDYPDWRVSVMGGDDRQNLSRYFILRFGQDPYAIVSYFLSANWRALDRLSWDGEKLKENNGVGLYGLA